MRHIANSLKAVTFALSLTSLVGLVGCDGAPDAGAPEEELVTSALTRGPGIVVGPFTCDDGANTCTCVGDAACDEMFGSGLCGGTATCDTSNPSQPVCTCTQALRVPTKRFGSVKISQATSFSLAR